MHPDIITWLKAFGLSVFVILLAAAATVFLRDVFGVDAAMLAGVTPP